MTKTIFTIISLVALNTAVAQDSPSDLAKQKPSLEDINTVLELGGYKKSIEGIKQSLLQQLEVSMQLTEKQENIFLAELDPGVKNYMERITEYFITEYTAADIKQLLTYYESPVGKKINKNGDKINDVLKDAYRSTRSAAEAALEKATAGNSKKKTQFEVH